MRYLMYYKDGYMKKFPLSGERVTIGRGRGCDIVLDDPSVSRRHCRIEIGADHIRLVNEKSKNGTTVDRQPVEEAMLALNQSFGVGGHEFFYKEGDVGEFRLSPELAWMSSHLLRPRRDTLSEPETREDGEKYTALLDEITAQALLCDQGDDFLSALTASLSGLFAGCALLLERDRQRLVLFNQTLLSSERMAVLELPGEPEGRLVLDTGALYYRRYRPQQAAPGFALLLLHGQRLPHNGGPADSFFAKLAHLILFNARQTPDLPDSDQGLIFEGGGVQIVGRSAAIRQTAAMMRKIAPKQNFILIMGENGTGKELFARMIHHLSGRKRYLAINCAAIPAALLESELFGYEAGAFTDARQRRIGKMEEASGGTLVLDEIGDMPAEIQAKLLRAIQERALTRLGGSALIPLDLRIIAMTNRDLYRLVEEGRFRQDLFFRLRVHEFTIPPLRERSEDIVPLVWHFTRLYAQRNGINPAGFSESASVCLRAYPWPGNIRELENEIARIMEIVDEGETISDHHLLPSIRNAAGRADAPTRTGGEYRNRVQASERDELQKLLSRHGGNKLRSAREAGMSYQGFLKKLKRLGIGGPVGGAGR